ncbi:MAG: ParB/RepB/Spo0J family partition protein [Verrucomicrobiota bacterium]
MAKKKSALGQGLGSLIKKPASSATTAPAAAAPEILPGENVVKLDLEKIVSSPFQPRKRFANEAIAELMESIREHGVIQPLIVRKVDGKYELIAGERRYRACQRLELDEAPVIVREATDRDVLEMALIENLQREDLNPIEEAEAYRRLAKDFSLRQEDIAQRVGKNRATVANAMRLLDLAEKVQLLVAQGVIANGHAKAILALKGSDEQELAADIVVKKKLTVRDTEKLVNQQLKGGGGSRTSSNGSAKTIDLPPGLASLQDKMRTKLGTNVALKPKGKGGKIEIEYYDNDDFGRLLELLGISVD